MWSQEKQELTEGASFFSAISHEIRTHLQAIGSAITLLDSGYSAGLPPDARRLLSIAGEELDRLVSLIVAVQDVEKLKSGQVPLCKSIFPAADLIENSVKSLAQRSRVLRLNLIGAARDDSTIYGDYDRLLTAFTNLALFTLDRSAPGTDIKMESMAKGPDTVRLALTVDKALFSPGLAEWLVTRFKADEEEGKEYPLVEIKYESVQLAIFKSIAQRHGADIGLETLTEKHSIVWLDLPNRQILSD